MSDRDLSRLDQVVKQVLVPLVAGGDLRPVPPFGTEVSIRLATHATALESDSIVSLERLARARALWPVDGLPPMSKGDWLLLFAFNDLVQAANPALPGLWHTWRARPLRLLNTVEATVERAGAPRTLGDALARHVTFARVLEIARPDTQVSWWTGSALFQGTKPPARLLAWPSVRRVNTSVDMVRVARLASGRDSMEGPFRSVLTRFLAATPLTDLGCIDRDEPAFVWTGATIGVVRSSQGRTLAERALRARGDLAAAARAALRATQSLAVDTREVEPAAIMARSIAGEFAQSLAGLAADRSYSLGSARRASSA